jgi:hypothetical protein
MTDRTGQGPVGEMTQLLSTAFDYTYTDATKLKGGAGRARRAVILLVDEADALAQSREAAPMHHEDRAGVNAFIRGLDRLANGQLPAAVIMCTNRLSALDPAVKRRAADIMIFGRPNDAQRHAVLSGALAPQLLAIADRRDRGGHRRAERPRLRIHLFRSHAAATADHRARRLSGETGHPGPRPGDCASDGADAAVPGPLVMTNAKG